MNDTIHRCAARRTRAAGAALALLVLALGGVGCQQKQASAVSLAPVAGKVTLNEQPLTEAVLEFIPTGNTKGQGGSATTDDEGRFTVVTPFGEEGLTAGDYQVVVSKLVLPKGVHFDVPPDKTLPPADNPYRESLPAQYSDRMNSKLTVKVAPSGTDKMSFTLRTSAK